MHRSVSLAIVFGTVILVALAMILIVNPEADIIVTPERLEWHRTPIGEIPEANRVAAAEEPPEGIVGNTIVNREWQFEISAPDERNWILYNDEEELTREFGVAGIIVPTRIEDIDPVQTSQYSEGLLNSVTVYIFPENYRSIEENVVNYKGIISEMGGYDVQELIYQEDEFGVIWYYQDFCAEGFCWTSLYVQTLEKSGTTLYNVEAIITPLGKEVPMEINDEVIDILGSFIIYS